MKGLLDSPNSNKITETDLLRRLALQLATLGQEIERWVLWLACLRLCLYPSSGEAAVIADVVLVFVAATEHLFLWP